MTFYNFRPKKVPVFSGFDIEKIAHLKPGKYRLDGSLGKGEIFVAINKHNDILEINDNVLSTQELRRLAKNGRRLYAFTPRAITPLVSVVSNVFYQMVIFEGCKTPTIEISGIHMHKVLVDPLFKDAYLKINILRPRPYSNVLEICTGLGYTTYWLLQRKCKVVSIEKNLAILQLAEYNPWSTHLENVPIILGDASRVIQNFDSSTFDYVVHDPPRYSIAPELYTRVFYEQIFNVLKPGGRIFHYVGKPGHRRGKKIIRGVMERLGSVGFINVRYIKSIEGIIAKKPKSIRVSI